MRIGIMTGAPGGMSGPGTPLEDIIAHTKRIESLGFASLWMANIFSLEAIATLGMLGRETERIELGTAVVPTYPRHPLVMAQEALTAAVFSGGRFTLGVGLSHKIVIEDVYGDSFARPARHMREYLAILAPALRGEVVRHKGELYNTTGRIEIPDPPQVPLLVAALGERMLRLAGAETDGTLPWMCGPRTLETHIGPTIRAAAERAGRPAPRIVAGFPILLTNRPDEARERMVRGLELYGTLPSYRAMLDREGAKRPADIALVGDEGELRKQLATVRDAGATDFNAAVARVDDEAVERTLAFLADEAQRTAA